MRETEREGQGPEEEPFVRVPGLYRDWEIPQLVHPGKVLHVEAAGEDEDGTSLYAVYMQEEGWR